MAATNEVCSHCTGSSGFSTEPGNLSPKQTIPPKQPKQLLFVSLAYLLKGVLTMPTPKQMNTLIQIIQNPSISEIGHAEWLSNFEEILTTLIDLKKQNVTIIPFHQDLNRYDSITKLKTEYVHSFDRVMVLGFSTELDKIKLRFNLERLKRRLKMDLKYVPVDMKGLYYKSEKILSFFQRPFFTIKENLERWYILKDIMDKIEFPQKNHPVEEKTSRIDMLFLWLGIQNKETSMISLDNKKLMNRLTALSQIWDNPFFDPFIDFHDASAKVREVHATAHAKTICLFRLSGTRPGAISVTLFENSNVSHFRYFTIINDSKVMFNSDSRASPTDIFNYSFEGLIDSYTPIYGTVCPYGS